MERYPQFYNYPVQLTEKNIKKHNALGRSLIVILKFSRALIVVLRIASGFNIQKGNTETITGNYFIFLVFGISFIPIVAYFVLSF
jgi:hypothetical protein